MSGHGGKAYREDASSVAKRCGQGPDPLSNVIDWLDTAELGNDVGDDDSGAACGGNGSAGMQHGARDLGRHVGPEPPPSSVMHGRCGPGAAMAAAAGGIFGTPRFCGHLCSAVSCDGQSQMDIGAARNLSTAENEDEEWDKRQKQTGAAGRLVVYEQGDQPKDDILLRGGGGRRLVVTAVTQGGKAFQSGVKAGDVLVSIDGRKGFQGKMADEVLAKLHAPVMIVFMGFVGKLHAEVRLNCDKGQCGLASQQAVVFGRPDARVQVIDEVCFQPTAPLFLTADSSQKSAGSTKHQDARKDRSPEPQQPSRPPPGKDSGLTIQFDQAGDKENTPSRESGAIAEATDEPMLMYELRNVEARNLVNRALARAQPASTFPTRFNPSPALPSELFTA